MDKLVEFLKEGLSSVVNNALNSSLPLLNEVLSSKQRIIEIVATFVIQLLIFLVLSISPAFSRVILVRNGPTIS